MTSCFCPAEPIHQDGSLHDAPSFDVYICPLCGDCEKFEKDSLEASML